MRTYLCALVDGNWGIWGDWSSCSESCGEGRSSRIRICDSPSPQYGGSDCILDDSFVLSTDANGGMKEIASKNCVVKYCPGTVQSHGLISGAIISFNQL